VLTTICKVHIDLRRHANTLSSSVWSAGAEDVLTRAYDGSNSICGLWRKEASESRDKLHAQRIYVSAPGTDQSFHLITQSLQQHISNADFLHLSSSPLYLAIHSDHQTYNMHAITAAALLGLSALATARPSTDNSYQYTDGSKQKGGQEAFDFVRLQQPSGTREHHADDLNSRSPTASQTSPRTLMPSTRPKSLPLDRSPTGHRRRKSQQTHS